MSKPTLNTIRTLNAVNSASDMSLPSDKAARSRAIRLGLVSNLVGIYTLTDAGYAMLCDNIERLRRADGVRA